MGTRMLLTADASITRMPPLEAKVVLSTTVDVDADGSSRRDGRRVLGSCGYDVVATVSTDETVADTRGAPALAFVTLVDWSAPDDDDAAVAVCDEIEVARGGCRAGRRPRSRAPSSAAEGGAAAPSSSERTRSVGSAERPTLRSARWSAVTLKWSAHGGMTSCPSDSSCGR